MDAEDQLILRLAAGDEVALALLYESLSRQVYALVLQLLHSREDAEEVLQDAFVKLAQTAERFNPDYGSARAYLYTIARNEALMRLRAKRSRPVNIPELDLHDPGSTFSAQKIDHDTRIAVATAFEKLEPSDAKLLKAAFYEGYSHGELSDKLGLPLGTVKSRVRRALLKMRDILGEVL
jgi:RNA polymerase sigma-70 factor (ECF subfamily)